MFCPSASSSTLISPSRLESSSTIPHATPHAATRFLVTHDLDARAQREPSPLPMVLPGLEAPPAGDRVHATTRPPPTPSCHNAIASPHVPACARNGGLG